MIRQYLRIGRQIRHAKYWLTPSARLCIGPSKPNPKSLVIVKGLPISITKESFEQALDGIDYRKVDIEPGCAVHIVDEAAAEYAAQQIRNKLNYKATVRSTCLPSLVLHNLPPNVTAENIQNSFEKFEPKVVRMSGKRCITVTLPDAESALASLKLIQSVSVDGTALTGHMSKSPDGRYCIHVNNIPHGVDMNSALKAVSDVVTNEVPSASLSTKSGLCTVRVRLSENNVFGLESIDKKIQESLNKISFGNFSPVSSSHTKIKKPALFLRNVKGIDETFLRTLCVEENKAERVQVTWRSRDMLGDIAVAYFKSEEEACEAIKWIKESHIGANKIKAAYKEMVEPAVMLRNVPSDLTAFKLQQMFSQFRISRVDFPPAKDETTDSRTALVVLSTPKEAERFAITVQQRNPGDLNMTAEEFDVHDNGLEFVFAENEMPSRDTIESALMNAGISFKSFSTDTNISAYVGFENTDKSNRSHNAFVNGSIQLLAPSNGPDDEDNESATTGGAVSTAYHGGGKVLSSLSIYPSYAIEVIGVPSDQSAECVIEAIGPDVDVLKAERAGTVKFKKHANVIPGMKALRGVQIDGVRLNPQRNHAIEYDGDSEYDGEGGEEGFDRMHFHMMMKDYLSAEPAIRYQMARNYFERALFTAQGSKDISYILDETAPNEIKSEARTLLGEREALNKMMTAYSGNTEQAPQHIVEKLSVNTGRLFQLYIQREDMLKFSSDFADWEAALGPQEADDIYSWNNFVLSEQADFDRLEMDPRSYNYLQTQKAEEKEQRRLERAIERRTRKGKDKREEEEAEYADDDSEEDDELESGESLDNVEGLSMDDLEKDLDERFLDSAKEKDKYDRFDADTLTDSDGHVWSGVIVHEDTTQKITTGGRVMSYRTLVVIGNMRGVGGYGMGKGETAPVSLKNAFRAALNNLIYLDLYENASLAHDLFGRDNNCWVYIRSTPKERVMVASPLAQMIFNQFGIVSCSCKIVGRRHPYAMIRAIFKALAKHKNIDEVAKERGRRYLTLKWMYDNAL